MLYGWITQDYDLTGEFLGILTWSILRAYIFAEIIRQVSKKPRLTPKGLFYGLTAETALLLLFNNLGGSKLFFPLFAAGYLYPYLFYFRQKLDLKPSKLFTVRAFGWGGQEKQWGMGAEYTVPPAKELKEWSSARNKQLIKNKDVYQYVLKKLRKGWNPESITGRLKKDHPNDPYWHICHETIYAWIFDQPKNQEPVFAGLST